MICTRCKIPVKPALYVTGYEDYCECQCNLDADFKQELWVS